MNLMVQRWQPGLLAQQKPRRKQPAVQDHDLPVLSHEESSRVNLDWEALMVAGVQPALILGAERRWQGPR